MYLIRTWYINQFAPDARAFCTQRYCVPEGGLGEVDVDWMLYGAMNLTHQMHFTLCTHLFTIGWPIVEPNEEGIPSQVRYVDAWTGAGKRNNYSGTPLLSDWHYLYVHRDCTFGRGGRELHKYCLTEDDVITHEDGKKSLKPSHYNAIGTTIMRSKIAQAMAEWHIKEWVPYQPKELNGGVVWAPVTGYHLAGLSVMKTLKDNVLRKGSAGNQGRIYAMTFVRMMAEHCAWLTGAPPWGGNTYPWWARNELVRQSNQVLNAALACCNWFFHEPFINIFATPWPAYNHDKYFELAGNAIRDIIPELKADREKLIELQGKQNPEATGIEYYECFLHSRKYLWVCDKLLKVRYTGHTQPIQLQNSNCM